MYGICGEQYSLDIIFDDLDRVEATRFRFMHQVMHSQEDYIRGLLETRRATDEFATRLTVNDYGPSDGPLDSTISLEGNNEKMAQRVYI